MESEGKKKGGFFRDFADFIKRGNIIDLAVAFIVGGAFQKIVSSLVNDIIMPIIGAIFRVNIQDGKSLLVDKGDEAANVYIYWGKFFQSIIDFLIIAFAIFVGLRVGIKIANKTKQLIGKKHTEGSSEEENK